MDLPVLLPQSVISWTVEIRADVGEAQQKPNDKNGSAPPSTRQSPRTGAAIDSIRPQKPTTANGIMTILATMVNFGSFQLTRGLVPSWRSSQIPAGSREQWVHNCLQGLVERDGPFRRQGVGDVRVGDEDNQWSRWRSGLGTRGGQNSHCGIHGLCQDHLFYPR